MLSRTKIQIYVNRSTSLPLSVICAKKKHCEKNYVASIWCVRSFSRDKPALIALNFYDQEKDSIYLGACKFLDHMGLWGSEDLSFDSQGHTNIN